MQTSISIDQAKAINGMLADAGRHYVISRNAANEAIPYGRAVIGPKGLPNNCRLPTAGKLVITDNAGTITAGIITSTIVHGASLESTVIATDFLTDKATTMAAHAAAILAGLADAYSCAYDGSAHTITLLMSSEDLVSDVTAASAPGEYDTLAFSSETVSSPDVAADVLGVSVMDHNREQQLVTGTTQYAINEPVNVLRQGAVYVYAEEAVNPDSTVYVRMVTNGTKIRGMFGASSDSAKCLALSYAKYADAITAAGLVKLEINLP